jgi:outer membrane autotransporter protein
VTQKHRRLPSLVQSSAGVTALVLAILSAPLTQPAHAQSCTPDPFGGETCLPDPDPNNSDNPGSPSDSNGSDRPRIPVWGGIPGVPAGVIFDRRKPYRVFEPQEAEPEVEPAPAPAPEPAAQPQPAPEPIRALWNKDSALPEPLALDYVNTHLRQQMLAQVQESTVSTAVTGEILRFGDTDYLEILEPTTLLYSHPYMDPGLTAWVNGYGAGDRLQLNNRSIDLNSGGVVFGLDMDLSDTFSLGLYGNYSSTDTSSSRGSWNPSGWGGGVTADWWTDNFYVQGLFGGTSFSGRQERKLNGDNASGDRSGNSWNAAVRLGAPIDAGSIYLEPQAQFSWTGATFDSFSESGVSSDQRLRFSGSNADLFGTELAIKIGVPLRSDERSLFFPSLRLGWIANWGQGNGNQTVRFIESGESYSYGMSTENANGLLVEAGLDYTTFNFNDTSVGVFVRGGPVFWGSGLGTSWRAWGGLSLDF